MEKTTCFHSVIPDILWVFGVIILMISWVPNLCQFTHSGTGCLELYLKEFWACSWPHWWNVVKDCQCPPWALEK